MEYLILTICGMNVIFSLALTVKCFIAQKQMQWLLPFSIPSQHLSKISVIIPARNEEHDIVASLNSVLNQEDVELEVIVVNDHSTDQTGVLVDEISKADSRVTVLHSPTLRPGWLGKCNAMQNGAEKATGDYLLFTDADILHAPNCFSSSLNAMKNNAYDFFSLSPLWDNESFCEHVNIPI